MFLGGPNGDKSTGQIFKTLVSIIGFLALLGFVGFFVFYCRSRKLQKVNLGFFLKEESLCEPTHPIMGASTIKDMIELTTSGSGSGLKYIFLHYFRIKDDYEKM